MPSRQSQIAAQPNTSNNNTNTPSVSLLMPNARRRDDRIEQRRDRSRNRTPRSRRQHRRITGYHNTFDELPPPDYDTFGSPTAASSAVQPPEYDCSVEAEDVMEIVWERTSPFQSCQMSPWRTVHVALRGTLLQISNAKTHGLLTPAWKRGTPTGEPGRKIRTYTLQHAEVGLASDHKRVEMVPKSPIAQLLPTSALKQLQETDPSQFEIVYNYIARVRVESEQILLRFANSDQRSNWIEKVCAAIDIAPPLEVRNEPRNHTLPRRRRREQPQRITIRTNHPQGVAPASLVAEQERILREHYPHLLPSTRTEPESQPAEPPDSPRSPQDGDNTEQENREQQGEQENEPDPDYQDLDLAFMRDPLSDNDPEDDERHINYMSNIFASIGQREALEQQHSPVTPNLNERSVTSSTDASPAVNNSTFSQPNSCRPYARNLLQLSFLTTDDRKYQPRHARQDPMRDARYRRRCMPMLVHNSRYATNMVMHKGKRKVIDWQNKKLVAWPADPPSYHDTLYANASSDTPKQPGEQDDTDGRENLPAGAANAILRIRGILKRHASSSELNAGARPAADVRSSPSQIGFRPDNANRPPPSRMSTRGDDSHMCALAYGTAIEPVRSNDAVNMQSLDSTPSITITTPQTTGYTSSSDDQSQSPALSFTDPNVKTKASNSSAFSRMLKQRFGRRSASDSAGAKMPPSKDDISRVQSRADFRAQSRATDRDEEGFDDKTIQSRLARIRTASSMDIMRNRI